MPIFESQRPKNKQRTSSLMLFATDIHGSDRTFKKFLNAILMYNVDFAILGGDVTGKMLLPLVAKEDGFFEFEFGGQKSHVKTDHLSEVEKMINDAGYYSFIVSEKDFRGLSQEQADMTFKEKMNEKLFKWTKLAFEKVHQHNIPIYATGGNDDEYEIDQILRGNEGIQYVESEVVKLDHDHELLSTGFGNITPWKCPRDITEEELGEKIEQLASKVTNLSTCVFNVHVPPINSSLDICPKLDLSVDPPKPIRGETTAGGSIAVRKAIEKYQPLLGLHGHIHESAGSERIGKTLCINPGSEYSDGVLKAALVRIENAKVKSFQLISG